MRTTTTRMLFPAFCLILLSSCGGGGSTPTPPGPVVTCATGERQVTLVNSTGEAIWVGLAAGTISCLSDADCPTQATGSCVGSNGTTVAGTCDCAGGASMCGSVAACDTSNNHCYWNLPSLTTAQVKLANGATSNICIPAPASGQEIQWSGNIFARTGCNATGQSCETGDCNANSQGICATGTGGSPPASLFEFTFSNQTSFATTPDPDYYDVSIINGINVGVTAGPDAGTYAATSDPYSCKFPGSTSAQGTLLACPWTVTPTVSGTNYSTLLRDVAPTTFSGTGSCPNGRTPNSLGYCACTADEECNSSGPSCGLAMNASAAQYTNVCGTLIGWWTADQLCDSDNGTSATPLAPLGCTTTVDNGDGVLSTHKNFFACTQPAGAVLPYQAQSCYTTGAAAQCCGCATSAAAPDHTDWPTTISSDFPGDDNGCYNNNPNWGTIVQPWLVYLKQTCPTAYTYPFDDATSTFTCIGSASVGAPNYTVTFLPVN